MSTEKIKNVVGFGKDLNDLAQPIGISGADNEEFTILSLNEIEIFRKILVELKKFNMYLSIATDEDKIDAPSYKNYNGS
jgi:hypothetical protein